MASMFDQLNAKISILQDDNTQLRREHDVLCKANSKLVDRVALLEGLLLRAKPSTGALAEEIGKALSAAPAKKVPNA